jgi:hypothetical protein
LAYSRNLIHNSSEILKIKTVVDDGRSPRLPPELVRPVYHQPVDPSMKKYGGSLCDRGEMLPMLAHTTLTLFAPDQPCLVQGYLGLVLDGSPLPVRHGNVSCGIDRINGSPGAVWDNAVGCPANMIW